MQWWAVYWSEPQGGRGAIPQNGSAVVQAANKLAAIQAANVPAGANVTNVNGPFPTQAAAQANVSGTLPTGSTPQSGNFIGSLTPFGAVGDFFHRLTEQQTWIRVGEVIGGGILLFIGVRALAQGSSVAGTQARKAVTKPVAKTAKRAATIAAPEVRYGAKIAAKRVAPKASAKVATHREKVRVSRLKPPPPRPPRQPTVRVSHIYHHAQTPKKKPVSLTKKPVKKP